MEHTHHPSPNYFGVFIILSVITILELGVTWEPVHQALPFTVALQIPLLMILGIAKAAYIVLYYMHLKFDSRLYGATFLLGIFLGLVFAAAVLLR